MLRRVGSAIGGILVLALLSTGCTGAPVIGVLLPSSGDAATYGESLESGIRLALSEARELDQVPEGLEVVWIDTQSDPARAVEEYHRVVNERGAKLVIGGATSAEAVALLPELESENVVCLSPSASAPGLAKQSKLFFRIFPNDELEGHTAGKFLHDRLRKTSVLLFAGNSEYTRGIEPEFRRQYEENLNGEVVGRIDLTQTDWREAATGIIGSSNPESAYAIGYAPEILEVLRYLDTQGFTGRIVTTSAFYSTRVIHEAGPLAEGILFPLPPFDRTSDKEPVVGFVHRYMDTYQRAPDVFAAHGYDAMRLAIEALKIALPPETAEIKKALHFGVSEFMGVTGPILFDDYGDVKHYPKMFIVKDGQVQSYQRYMKTERARILREVQSLLVEPGGGS